MAGGGGDAVGSGGGDDLGGGEAMEGVDGNAGVWITLAAGGRD